MNQNRSGLLAHLFQRESGRFSSTDQELCQVLPHTNATGSQQLAFMCNTQTTPEHRLCSTHGPVLF